MALQVRGLGCVYYLALLLTSTQPYRPLWWVPAILLMSLQNVRYMWEVELLSSRLEDVGTCKNDVSLTGGMTLPHSPGTVNSGAHNTIDAQRHMEGLTVWELIGTYNTVEVNVGAYNTVCVRTVAEYCSVQGTVPGTVV